MKKLYLLIIVSLVVLQSTAQLKKFTVEIPNTPKFKISDSIQSFTLLNRSITPEFSNFNSDSLQISFYKQNFRVTQTILDSIAADTTIKVLGELLFESERFDVVIPVDRNIYRLLPFAQTPEPLSWNYVESICEQFKTDALIVLENQAMHTNTNYKTQHEFIDFSREKTYLASVNFKSRTHWRIYDPKKKQIIVDHQKNEDSLYWESYEYDLRTTFRKLPSIKEAAIQTAVQNAVSFSDLIAPSWVEETRYYFVLDDTLIDKSVTLASDGNWKAAYENWKPYADQGKSVKKSKIMFNLALAAEMNGDLDLAIEWAKKSKDAYYREVSNYYINQLNKRKSEIKK
ncbi:MAG: hypothetical protein GXX78_10535 [Bacteroidales bacterium]|nr:hypothetical protein [Bacteroidales bacterium]